jgi:hypothetical protein
MYICVWVRRVNGDVLYMFEWGEWTVMYICVWVRRVNGDIYTSMCLAMRRVNITVHSPHSNIYNTSPFTLLTQTHIIHHRSLSPLRHIYTSPFILLTQTHIYMNGDIYTSMCLAMRRVNGGVYMCLAVRRVNGDVLYMFEWGQTYIIHHRSLSSLKHIYTSPFTLLTQTHILYVFEWREWTVMYYMCLSEESERWCIHVFEWEEW